MANPLAGLIPQPVSVRPGTGTLTLTSCPEVEAAGPETGTQSRGPAGAAGPATGTPSRGPAAATHQAAAAVRRVLTGLPWPPTRVAATTQPVRCTVAIDEQLGPEAYQLSIRPDGIGIVAGGESGAGYAAQTVRQLLPPDAFRSAPLPGAADWQLPCAEIDDRPALSWRGAHIDTARHFVPKRELLALTDTLAALKFNRLHLHLTDDQGWRIESTRHPALHEIGSHRPRTRISLNSEEPQVYDETPHGGYYTLADLAEIASYARLRGIEIVPEIDLPGHSAALLAAMPELGAGPAPEGGYQVSPDWGIFPHLIAPLPQTMGVLRDVFGELIQATGARFVHIGGDECLLGAWRDDPRVEAAWRERGLSGAEELHAAFLHDLADMLAGEFGARSVVWDEGFTSAAGRPDLLRPDTVVMAWRGLQVARAAAEAGHDVVAAPVRPVYFDYYQERASTEPAAIGGPVRLADVAAFAPAPADWPPATREHLIGTQFQLWTEYVRDSRALEYMIFPRACALADVAWSGGAAGPPGDAGAALIPDRVEAHLARLDAAGIEYRPLAGPRPWQEGGTGPRRHRDGYLTEEVAAHLDLLAGTEQQR